jgi:site-specific DNA recombinase
VSAPDIEQLVCDALKGRLNAKDGACDRDLIRARIERIVIESDRITVTLREPELEADLSNAETAPNRLTELTIPFAPKLMPRKGVVHAPIDQGTIDSEMRETLLKAIARSCGWMETILSGKAASFNDIALSEGLAERYVRRLAVLAFLSPKVVRAIADGAAPSGVTVSSLTLALPHAWAGQERMLGLS